MKCFRANLKTHHGGQIETIYHDGHICKRRLMVELFSLLW
jgi:hypothetical protein